MLSNFCAKRPRKMKVVQFLFFLSGYFLLIGACQPGTSAESTVKVQEAGTVPDGTNGAAIYRQYCVACHGADGKLGLNGAGDLTMSKLTLEERIVQISKGKNMMAPFEEVLTPKEIKAVAEYTLRLKKK